jgi:hypothetical protein
MRNLKTIASMNKADLREALHMDEKETALNISVGGGKMEQSIRDGMGLMGDILIMYESMARLPYSEVKWFVTQQIELLEKITQANDARVLEDTING